MRLTLNYRRQKSSQSIARTRTAVALLASLSLCETAALAPAAPPGWMLTFQDEFDGQALNASQWDPINWTTPFNNERQAYHPSRATVENGNLVLTADDADYGGKSYTSGKVESKYVQQYGRWEIRAKLPGTQGTWPAIWLLPATEIYNWPTQGEIDILENRGHQPHLTSSAYHWGPSVAGHQYLSFEQSTSYQGVLDNYHEAFHTYAVEWDADKLRFFVDDVHYFSILDAWTGGFLSSQTAPMELVMNVAVGGDFVAGQQPDSSSVWPQQMLVDYVRVYERRDQPLPTVFRNGSFDDLGGSLAHWSVFGNSAGNVQAHREAVLDGTDSLKIYGQFNGAENYSGVQQGISVEPGDRLSATAKAMVLSSDDLAGGNRVVMKFDYFTEMGALFGTPQYLGSDEIQIADAATTNDFWHSHELTGTAPPGAVEARLAFVFVQPDFDGGAIHIDDVEFINLDLARPADADQDGDVDGTDLLNWQRGFPLDDATTPADGDFDYDGVVGAADLHLWQAQFGEGSVSAGIGVPEPATWTFLVLGSAVVAAGRYRLAIA